MKQNTNTLAIISLIIGIIALLLSCCLGGFLGIAGVILSILALNMNQKKSFAITGLVTSLMSILITLVTIIFFIFVPTDSDNASDGASTESVKEVPEIVEESSSEERTTAQSTEVTTQSTEKSSSNDISQQFDIALREIGMEPSNVKNINSLDDWASGTRYSFIYDEYRYIVYELDNGEISSICNDNLSVKIFERGYKSLNYKDFEPDTAITQDLMDSAIEEVSKYITNETSIKSKLGTTSVYRIYNYYSITGEVKAKNKADKETFSFTVDFEVEEGSFRCIYVSVDGETAYGEQKIPDIKKEETTINEEGRGNSEVIVISWDKIGEYGQKDLFDGEEFIRYYIPAGNYEVKCNVRGGFYIETIALHKEDGYDTAEIISQNMMDSGDSIEVTIEEGQCISLIINTEIELVKQ